MYGGGNDDVIDLTIRGKDEFSSAATHAKESALSASRSIEDANRQMARSADDTARHVTETGRTFATTGTQARAAEGHFSSFSGAVTRSGTAAKTSSGHFLTFGKAVSGIAKPFDLAGTGATKFGSRLGALTGTMVSAGTAALKYGSVLAGMFLAAGVGLAKFQLDQEDLWDSIQGNIGATDKQMAVMREGANRLARETGQALETIAHGFERASNFGYRGAAGFKVVEVAAKAAQVTGGNTADTMNTLGRIMANFHQPASAAARTMDVLVASNAQANSSLDVFGQNFQRVSSYAAGLKIPLTQASGAFALLARNMPAPQAAAGMTAFLRGIVKPSSTATAELVKLSKATGIDLVKDFSASGLASKGLSGVLADLHAATNGNVGEMQKLIAGTRGVPAAALLAGEGWRDYTKNVNAATDSHGKLDKTFHAMASQWDDTLGRIREVGKQILASITGPLSTGAASPLHFIEVEANALLARMPAIMKGLSAFGTAISPAIDAAKQQLGAFFSWIPGAAKTAFDAITPVLQSLGPKIGSALGSIGGVAGPIAETIKNALAPVFSGVVTVAQAAFEKLPGILSGIGTRLEPIFAGIGTAAAAAWNKLPGILSGIGTALEPIAVGIGKKVSAAFDTITAPKSLDAMAGAFRAVGKAAEDLGKGFGSTFQGSKDLDGLLKSLSKSGDQIGDSFHRAGVQLGLFGDSAGGKGANNLRDFGALVGRIANVTLVGLGQEIEQISKLLSVGISLIGGIGKTLMDTFTDVKKVFGDMGQLADDLIHGHWAKIAPDAKAIFMDVVHWAGDTGRDLLRTFVNVGEDIVGPHAMGRIISWAKSMPGHFMSAVSSLWTELPAKAKDAAGNMMSGMAGGIKNKAGAIKDAMVHAFEGALAATGDTIKNAAGHIFQPLIDAWDKVKGLLHLGGGLGGGLGISAGGAGPFGLANVTGAVYSSTAGESSLLGGRTPAADLDYLLPPGTRSPVTLPGGRDAIYQLLAAYMQPGVGGIEEFAGPNNNRFSFLHLSQLASPGTYRGGQQVGVTGWPTSPEFGNGVAGPGNAQLCVVYDANGNPAALVPVSLVTSRTVGGGLGPISKVGSSSGVGGGLAFQAGSTSEPVKVHVVMDDTHSRAGLDPSIRYAADLPRGGHRAPPVVGDPLPLGARYSRGMPQRGYGPSLMDWSFTGMDYTGDWRANPALTGHYSGYQSRMALQGAPFPFAAGPAQLHGVPGGTMGGLLPRDPYGTFNAAYSAYGGIGRQISNLAAPSTLAGLPKDLRDQMRDAAKGFAAEFRDAGRTLNHDIAAENTRHRNALGQINGQAITKQEQELERHQQAMARIGDRTSAAAGAESRRHEAIDRGISQARNKQLEAENAERNRNIAQLKETYREHVSSLRTELTAFQKGVGTLLSPAAIFSGFQQMFQGRVANAQAAATLSYWRGQAPAPIAPGAIRAADQLRSMDVASARGQILTSRATGDLAGFQAGLQALDAAIRTQLVADIIRGGDALRNHAAQLARVAETERLTAIGAAAMNLRIDGITRSFDGFMSDLDAAGSAIRSEILAGAIASGSVNAKYLAGLVAVTDAQEAGANAQNGLNLMLAAARVDVAGMQTGLQAVTSTLTDRWTRAVMDGYGAMNQFTPGLIKAAQASRDLATGMANRDVILGGITHNFEQISSGLSTLFSQAQSGLSFFGAMIGRGGDIGENITTLAGNALTAATNLDTFSGMLAGFQSVLGQIGDVASRQVAFSGAIDPSTITAYQAATEDQRKAMWDQVQSNLTLTRSTHDLSGFQQTLGNEVALQATKVRQLGITAGMTSAEYLHQQQILKDLQKEQEGVGLAMRLLDGDTSLTADQTLEAQQALKLFTDANDPATAALIGATGQFTIAGDSAGTMASAIQSAQNAALNLGDSALNDAGKLATFGTAITDATTSLQQLINAAGASSLSTTAPGMLAPFGGIAGGGSGGGSAGGGRRGAQPESGDTTGGRGSATPGTAGSGTTPPPAAAGIGSAPTPHDVGAAAATSGQPYSNPYPYMSTDWSNYLQGWVGSFPGGTSSALSSSPTSSSPPTYSFSSGGGEEGGISLPGASSASDASSPYSYTATHGILAPGPTPVAVMSVSPEAARSMGGGISTASSSSPVAVTTPALRAINPSTGLPGGPFYAGSATVGMPVGMIPMSKDQKDSWWANAQANAGTATGMDKFKAAQLFPTLAAEIAATEGGGYGGININGVGYSTYNGEIQVPGYLNNPSLLTGMGTGMGGPGSMGGELDASGHLVPSTGHGPGTGSLYTGTDIAAMSLQWAHDVNQYMVAYGLGIQGEGNGNQLVSPIDFSQNAYYNALAGAGALPNAGQAAGYDPQTGLFANPQTMAQMNWNTRMGVTGPNQNASGFQVNRAIGPGVWNAGNGYIGYTNAPASDSMANMLASGMVNGMTSWFGGPNAFGPVDPNATGELSQANPLLGLKFGRGFIPPAGTDPNTAVLQQIAGSVAQIADNTSRIPDNWARDVQQWSRDLIAAYQADITRHLVAPPDFRSLWNDLGMAERMS